MTFARTIALALLVTFGLSACDSAKFWRAKKPEPCPRVTVLKNASEITKFKDGPGRDLIDVLFEAKVTNVLSQCTYDVDYDTRAGSITAQIAPVISGLRGAANQTKFGDVEYFVAVVDDKKKILQKNTFPLRIAFPGNLTQNEIQDEPVTLTLNTDGNKNGADFEIYVGFQLSREEMDYNSRQAAR